MPLFYQPMRFRRLTSLRERRYKALQAEASNRIGVMKAVGASLEDVLSTIMPDFLQREFLGQMDEQERVNREHFYKHAQAMYLNFQANGSNIFDMSRLVPLFRHTDVDDLDLTGTPVPYKIFYLHFGEEAGLIIPGLEGVYVEGAYVGQVMGEAPEDQGLALMFVCSHPEWEHADEVPFAETLRRATRLARCVLLYNMPIKEGLRTVEGLDGDPDVYECDEVMRDAIRMAVNSVLYLALPDLDVEEGYAEDAPAKLVERALKGHPKAMRELANHGYLRVAFCGRNTVHAAELDGGGSTVQPHWRRGHYQRFAVGVGRTERRWQWVRPTVVNRHMGAPQAEGRVYDVDGGRLQPGNPPVGLPPDEER